MNLQNENSIANRSLQIKMNFKKKTNYGCGRKFARLKTLISTSPLGTQPIAARKRLRSKSGKGLPDFSNAFGT